jgi:hypothetical protein
MRDSEKNRASVVYGMFVAKKIHHPDPTETRDLIFSKQSNPNDFLKIILK